MSDFIRNIRYKIAYMIAPDWIDDLECRLSGFLSVMTGGRLSKCYYTLDVMVSEAYEYQERCCEECRKEEAQNEDGVD